MKRIFAGFISLWYISFRWRKLTHPSICVKYFNTELSKSGFFSRSICERTAFHVFHDDHYLMVSVVGHYCKELNDSRVIFETCDQYSFLTWYSYPSVLPSPLTTFTATNVPVELILLFYISVLYWKPNPPLPMKWNSFFEIWAIFSSHSSFSVRPPNLSVMNVLNASRIDPIVIALNV